VIEDQPGTLFGILGGVIAGERDLNRAAAELASRVPERLGVLARLAYNYRWSWWPGGPDLFKSVDPDRWARVGQNPVHLLQEASTSALLRAAADDLLIARAEDIERGIAAELDERPDVRRGSVFFCAEYGVHASLPIYSGGLGALAGDILKEASDQAAPLAAVGLLYRQGYFRQRIDATGMQHEYWVDTDPDRLPAALVTGEDGAPLTVTVAVDGEDLVAQIWRVDIGRVPLFLLDADRPENALSARWTTSRLYAGDPEVRLAQYVLLGIGGMKAIEAVGINPSTVHLNEGHAAFAGLELARTLVERGFGAEEALDAVRRRTLFTTHTPVPAGNDTYPVDQVREALRPVAEGLGVDPWELVRRGRTHPDDDHEPFGVTQFALRLSRAANGVSRRHGEVARGMWHGLWPDRELDYVPITHVTNGVHLPTWVGGPMRALLDRHLGDDWMHRADDPATYEPVDGIPDEEIWAARQEQRAALIAFVRDRAVVDRLGRDDPRSYARAASDALSPDVLTIGFARRLATYKRLHLLLKDRDRSYGLLSGDRPIQLLIAGKAHPRDSEGKRLVQELFVGKDDPRAAAHIAYLDDYDLASAALLVQGCDVWLNVPRPPLEASGTSGMKSAANGGLNLSVLDGWWAEGHDPAGGWAIDGGVDHDHWAQDERDGAELYRLLEEEVAPGFYTRDEAGLPRDWIARVRVTLKTLLPQFSAARMVHDYRARLYGDDVVAASVRR
jgi:starch phosphorylase